MRIRYIVALAAALLAAAPAAAQQTQEFHSTAGFTVELPAHWELMPCEAMAEAMASDAAGYDLEAVFKVGNAPWLAPPMFGIAWVELPEKMTVKEFGEEFTVPDAQEYLQAELFGTPAGDGPRRPALPAGTRTAGQRGCGSRSSPTALRRRSRRARSPWRPPATR